MSDNIFKGEFEIRDGNIVLVKPFQFLFKPGPFAQYQYALFIENVLSLFNKLPDAEKRPCNSNIDLKPFYFLYPLVHDFYILELELAAYML